MTQMTDSDSLYIEKMEEWARVVKERKMLKDQLRKYKETAQQTVDALDRQIYALGVDERKLRKQIEKL